jgi:hypothetical protein
MNALTGRELGEVTTTASLSSKLQETKLKRRKKENDQATP